MTYYISPNGNDADIGTSELTAWKTPARANKVGLSPGVQFLFQGGTTHNGNLKWTGGSGSAQAPVLFGSYGNGKATINPGSGRAFYGFNVGGISFDGLNFAGTVDTNKKDAQTGLQFESDRAGTIFPPVSMTNCDIGGFYKAGVLLVNDVAGSGFESVNIQNNTFHDCVIAGMLSWAPLGSYQKNVYFANNTLFNNYGAPDQTCSGNGGWFCGLGDGSVLEKNLIYNNGGKGVGGCGFWTNGSDGVLISRALHKHEVDRYD
jgi:hypothetical protein